MNRWTGTAHLTRDPELVTTSGGTEICLMRIAVKRAARDGAAGYFDVKAFEGQARACAEYLSAGREVAIEGRLRFEEFETERRRLRLARLHRRRPGRVPGQPPQPRRLPGRPRARARRRRPRPSGEVSH